MKKIALIGLLALGACDISTNWKYIDDNIVEELLEGFLEKETGVEIDLTPNSQEEEYKGFTHRFPDMEKIYK